MSPGRLISLYDRGLTELEARRRLGSVLFRVLDKGPGVPQGFAEGGDETIPASVDLPAGEWARLRDRLASGDISRVIFIHPEIGPIMVMAGRFNPRRNKQGFGLAKISGKHADAIEHIPELLLNGQVALTQGSRENADRVILQTAGYLAVIRLDLDGIRCNWLMTAYRRHRFPQKSAARLQAVGNDGSGSSFQPDITNIQDAEEPGKAV